MGKRSRVKKLSICIPTYNRAPVLDRLLNNIHGQIQGLEKWVEICISDNASTDATPQIISKWKLSLPICSARNPKNHRYDINAVRVFSLARGNYVWFMGDDDLLADGALRRVVDDIAEASKLGLDAIYINTLGLDGILLDSKDSKFMVLESDSRQWPLLDISFMGCICVRRALASRILTEKTAIKDGLVAKKEVDSNAFYGFVHSYIFLECLSVRKKLGVEPRYCIKIIADGERFSYEKQMFLNVIILTYPLEIRLFYPWANFGLTRGIPFLGHLFRVCIAAKNPKLNDSYKVCLDAYVELLRMGSRQYLIPMIFLIEKIRVVYPFSLALPALYKIFRRKRVDTMPVAPFDTEKYKLAVLRGRQIIASYRKRYKPTGIML
jgi:glycosyltransferase involved in cell wall biosynthesis